ncbi:putative GAF sensor protein [Parafrankia sp. EUN1f]|nr:putative GAF sensor protein [Parafrankia sp. EUN1f]
MEGPETRDHNDEMRRVLDLARRHLRTDVAWLARFSGDHQVIDLVAGDGELVESLVGYRVDMEQTYCARVLDGRLPAVVPDARADSRTANLPVTRDLGIGSYVGTPVHLDNGELYGMLCALGTEPDPNLGERDVRFLSLLADVLTDTVSAIHRGHADDDHIRSVIGEIIDSGGPTMVFQAVFDLPTHGIVGAEALARFPGSRRLAACGPRREVGQAAIPVGGATTAPCRRPSGSSRRRRSAWASIWSWRRSVRPWRSCRVSPAVWRSR